MMIKIFLKCFHVFWNLNYEVNNNIPILITMRLIMIKLSKDWFLLPWLCNLIMMMILALSMMPMTTSWSLQEYMYTMWYATIISTSGDGSFCEATTGQRASYDYLLRMILLQNLSGFMNPYHNHLHVRRWIVLWSHDWTNSFLQRFFSFTMW